MSTFITIAIMAILVVVLWLVIARVLSLGLTRDIERGARASVALDEAFNESSIVKRCPVGLSPWHRWVPSTVVSTSFIHNSPIEEKEMHVSAECSKCRSRVIATIPQRDWWLYGLIGGTVTETPP